MTPQEFFKKDLFAEQTGVELLEVREGDVYKRQLLDAQQYDYHQRTEDG